MMTSTPLNFLVFFFNDTATTEIYTLSLHDALPISWTRSAPVPFKVPANTSSPRCLATGSGSPDRKSTRLNSSHLGISYAVFCLKKKNKNLTHLGHALIDRQPTHSMTDTTLPLAHLH